jgi:bifunctional non-homologous end joining protein LigD
VDDVRAAFKKGDLKFELDGYKLKGSWALVRTRGYGGERGEGRSWLLIKHRDDWAGDLDITTFAPLSVKSKQDLHEILAADDPDVWRTNRPVAGGATGAMLRDIIEKAAALKAGRSAAPPTSAPTVAKKSTRGRSARPKAGPRPPSGGRGGRKK